jgi:Cytochrome oxidase complex assembly protein 1
MRKVLITVVAIVVAASCIPWLRRQSSFSVLVGITAIALAAFIVFRVVRALAGWSKREHQQGRSTQSAWWSPRLRNLSLGAAIILVLMFTVPHFVATAGGAYKLALATANQTPQFAQVLGAPIREAWFSEGRTEYGNPAKAVLTIPVTGSKQKGNLQVIATKEDGHWKLKQLTLELAGSGEQINLLSSSR